MDTRQAGAADDAVDPKNLKSFNALMQSYLSAHMLTGWTPSAEASIRVELGDGSVIDFVSLAIEPRLAIQVRMAPLPADPDARLSFYGWLLHQNAAAPGDMQFTVDDAADFALCQRQLLYEALDVAHLQAAVTDLLAQAKSLRQTSPFPSVEAAANG